VGAVSPSILILFIAGFSTIRGFAERLSELIKSLLETDASVIRLTSITADGGALGTLPVPKLSEILMRDLSFTHTNSHHQIRIPYFALRPGDRILITGRSGQGKSTFLSILARQLFPAHGESLWNGVGYQHYDTSLAEVFAYAGQEAELFNLSLRDNLRMGRDYSDQDLREILCDLGLEGFLKSLPEGLDSKLGERALKLSAGQKQRINIARAILLNRPVLLLDEPTSHLDQDSERCVIERLGKLSPEAAIVVVSHQPIFREWCQKELTFETGVLKWT
jgi:ABC-type bacteriocin/lantibiotic exporter with double-glycine peptidase domain